MDAWASRRRTALILALPLALAACADGPRYGVDEAAGGPVAARPLAPMDAGEGALRPMLRRLGRRRRSLPSRGMGCPARLRRTWSSLTPRPARRAPPISRAGTPRPGCGAPRRDAVRRGRADAHAHARDHRAERPSAALCRAAGLHAQDPAAARPMWCKGATRCSASRGAFPSTRAPWPTSTTSTCRRLCGRGRSWRCPPWRATRGRAPRLRVSRRRRRCWPAPRPARRAGRPSCAQGRRRVGGTFATAGAAAGTTGVVGGNAIVGGPHATVAPALPTAAPAASDAEVAAQAKGRFTWPLRGQILSGFGVKGPGQRNDGVNIAAESGETVKAAAAGVVVYAGNSVPAFGNLVLVKHPGGWATPLRQPRQDRGEEQRRGGPGRGRGLRRPVRSGGPPTGALRDPLRAQPDRQGAALRSGGAPAGRLNRKRALPSLPSSRPKRRDPASSAALLGPGSAPPSGMTGTR